MIVMADMDKRCRNLREGIPPLLREKTVMKPMKPMKPAKPVKLMTLDDWARAHLIVPLPRDFRVWHWTRSPEQAFTIRAAVAAGGDLSAFGAGATGHGLYLSTSAVDLIDRGQEVVAATIVQGTPALMVDPDLFGVGFSELLEHAQRVHGLSWKPPSFRRRVDPAKAQPAPEAIDGLLDRLGAPCCEYSLGLHLAFMVRDARCLRLAPEAEQARTVADYVAAHPEDRPMLVPSGTVSRWIAARVR